MVNENKTFARNISVNFALCCILVKVSWAQDFLQSQTKGLLKFSKRRGTLHYFQL